MTPKCKKRAYKDKEHAVFALHKINNTKDGRVKPVRAYQCEICLKWHLTKQEIDRTLSKKYKPKLDWSAVIKKGE